MGKKKNEVAPPLIFCSCTGQKMSPTGAGFEGVVKSQRYVSKLGMLLLYFENGYVCSNQVCKLVVEKEEKSDEQKNNSTD